MQTKIMLAAAMLVTTAAANASEVTSIVGGTSLSFPAVNYQGNGPQTVAPGITWSSNSSQLVSQPVFGFTSDYGFGLNGAWNYDSSHLIGPMAALDCSQSLYALCDSSHDSMTFSFAAPVSAVGGFLNYSPRAGNPTIAVYDSSHTLIEEATLSFVNPASFPQPGFYNFGEFLGFQEATNEISYFTLSDAYVGIANLTTLTTNSEPGTTIPEPTTLALLGLGFAGLGLTRTRRRK